MPQPGSCFLSEEGDRAYSRGITMASRTPSYRRKGNVAGLFAVGLLALLALTAAGIWATEPSPRQSPREADRALAQMMEGRAAVQGKTRRGQAPDEAPSFKVVPRKADLGRYPCSGCHDNVFIDARVRVLKEEHSDLKFEHGGGRYWCYDVCHNGRDMDHLVSLRRRPIDYDEAYKLCGQCHFQRYKDWNFGGHGKRAGAWPIPREVPEIHGDLRVSEREKIGTWRGERMILSCPACHDPHSPAVKPFIASPPPQVRSGLTQPPAEPEAERPIWQRIAAQLGLSAPGLSGGVAPAVPRLKPIARPEQGK